MGRGGLAYLTYGARPWAADNACFAHAEDFDLSAYLAWLDVIPREHMRRCLFATAPDVIGDWATTWARSRDVLPLLRARGFAAAVIVQEGATAYNVPWDSFDALFVGGKANAWKEGAVAERLCNEARDRGKWVHMGRVNSLRRMLIADRFRCHSADGTYVKFGPRVNLPKVLSWLDVLHNW